MWWWGVKARSLSTTDISEVPNRRGQTSTAESKGAIQESHRQGRGDISSGTGLGIGHYLGKVNIYEGNVRGSLSRGREVEGSAKTPHQLPRKSTKLV